LEFNSFCKGLPKAAKCGSLHLSSRETFPNKKFKTFFQWSFCSIDSQCVSIFIQQCINYIEMRKEKNSIKICHQAYLINSRKTIFIKFYQKSQTAGLYIWPLGKDLRTKISKNFFSGPIIRLILFWLKHISVSVLIQ
jgi:hypothetical protein